jgi:hypothetical protein
MGKVRHFTVGREKKHHSSRSSQASPVPPSDKSRVKVLG